MVQLAEYATIKSLKENNRCSTDLMSGKKLDTDRLRNICLDAGADDVGFVEIGRNEITDQKEDILAAFPRTKTLVCMAHRINRDSVRTPARQAANIEFKHVNNQLIDITRKTIDALASEGVGGIIESGLFPMNMDSWPDKLWIASLKPLAVAAGLGSMGLNRLILHPKFGGFMYMSALLIDGKMTEYSKPIEHNPCLNCKICASICPTGAIANDGYFTFTSCLTHNYREKLGGFSDWVEQIIQSKSPKDYRNRVSDAETISMWQSLSFGANSKCDYCMAVCPAGEDVVGQFIKDRKSFIKEIVKPLKNKKETIYVVSKSDAGGHATRRFPHKKTKQVGNGLRARTIQGFLDALPLLFQRNQSDGIDTTYHFTFTGEGEYKASVIIQNKSIDVQSEHVGKPDIHIIADSKTWLKFLAKEKNIVWALLTRKIRIKGSVRLLSAFGKCFPS